jgi:hypothetical protein
MKAPLSRQLQPKRQSPWLGLAILVSLLLALAAVAIWLPRAWSPWKPLNVNDRVTPVTKWKLAKFSIDHAACRTFLRSSDVDFVEVPDRSEGGFCTIDDAIRLKSGGPPLYPNTPILSCPVAAGLVIWHRKTLTVAAEQSVGAKLTKINHLGSYACRRQYGRKTGLVSEHASANALDVSGFGFSNGKTISVLGDWQTTPQTPDARFLERAHGGACGLFKVVLGPEANAAHANHFHVDMGPFISCR